MPRKRRSYPTELKAKVALEALREEAPMAELRVSGRSVGFCTLSGALVASGEVRSRCRRSHATS